MIRAILAAAKEGVGQAKARRVSLNFFPPSSDVYGKWMETGYRRALIMANALVWVSTVHNTLRLF
jgi:hypothetical protein